MKWYIGQEIVAIKNYSKGGFKKGDVFVIQALRNSPCKCNIVLIDIGIMGQSLIADCGICFMEWDDKDYTFWFSEKIFAPLDFDISELTKILETPLELVKK